MRKAFYLALLAALIASIAQYFLKTGADKLPAITLALLFGLFLYVVSTPFLIGALIFGEVSYVFPVYASSFIFVSLISVFLIGETMSLINWIGIILLTAGVIIIK